jgi:UDP-2,3-diacylglucosamine hydrolase
MSSLFISDLHLSSQKPQLTQLFFSFLQRQAKKAEAFYILGDLFDAWIGDDDQSLFNQSIMQALAELTRQGVLTYFMPGNRDFLIGQSFIKKTGCRLLMDPCLIMLYGIPTLLTHGDLLCTLDQRYLTYRRFAHTKFLQTLFLQLPLSTRQKIATYLRKEEHEHFPCDNKKFDIVMDELVRWLKKYHAQWIIHGHTHQPCIQLFRVNKSRDKFQKRFVLSDWNSVQGNVLIVSPNKASELIYFS